MFVTAADFDLLPYSIPNLDKVDNTFQDYVDVKEKEILQSLLGASLYQAFIDGLAVDPPEQRWVDLRNGAPYIVNNHSYVWKGMVALLKPYIYSEWLRDTADTHTGIGVVVGNPENSIRIDPGTRIARAWNVFANLAGTEISDLFYYDSWCWYDDGRGCCHDLRNTLYGYLKQTGASGTFDDTFDETFTDFQQYLNFWFTDPGTKNVFNI